MGYFILGWVMEMVVIDPQGYNPPRGIVIGKRLKKEKYDETATSFSFPDEISNFCLLCRHLTYDSL